MPLAERLRARTGSDIGPSNTPSILKKNFNQVRLQLIPMISTGYTSLRIKILVTYLRKVYSKIPHQQQTLNLDDSSDSELDPQ